MNIKEELYKQCVEFVENRFQTIQNTIKEIQESLGSETKSSAGELHIEKDTFYAISANTPIGQLLIGKTIDVTIKFREQAFQITKIL